ncbi:hypothetical protein, partial [Citrobacter freundii]|uniref:hypothetical protein n=1 Tax=Citrobacter freundii TaxID=546 RepID=UPI00195351CF
MMFELSTKLARNTRPLRVGAMLVLLAVPLGACSSLSGGWDKLFGKEEVAADEPADKLYNEGLY